MRLIDAAPNRLYRMILVLLYATGVRRAEAARIKVEDIDSQRMVIHIRQGKGAERPRCAALSEAARGIAQLVAVEEAAWLSLAQHRTAGQRGIDQPISDKTVWHACRAAATRAGLTKKIHPHTPTAQLCDAPARSRRRPAHDSAADGP